MILLRLAGVSRQAVTIEYQLTNRGLEGCKKELISALTRTPYLRLSEDGAKILIGAKGEYMDALYELLDEGYGGAEDYLQEVVGLSKKEVE